MSALALVLWLAAAPAAGSAMDTARLTDGEALAAVQAVNEAALAAADLALKRAKGAAALAYLAREKKAHERLKSETARLSKRAGIAPVECDASAELRAAGRRALERLQRLEGSAFAAAYVDTQERLHRRADQALDRQQVGAKDYFITLLLAETRDVLWALSDNHPSFAADYPTLDRPED